MTTLSGTSTYTGATTINSGATLAIASASAIGSSTINLAGGTLSVANGTSLTQAISLSSDSMIAVSGSASTAGAIALNGNTLTISGGALTIGSYLLTGTITPTLGWQTPAPTTTFYTDYNTPLTPQNLSVTSGGAGSANYTVTILYGSGGTTTATLNTGAYTLSHGTLTISGNTFAYTPTGSSAATETFTYQITDASGLAPNTISKDITINIATPITVSAISESFNFCTGAETVTNAFTSVASGGTGPYIYYLWDGATRQTSTTGTYGTASVNGVGFTYTPTSNQFTNGVQDSFSYVAVDANGLVSANPGALTLTNTYVFTTIGGASTENVPYNQSVSDTLAVVSGTGSGTYSYTVTIFPTNGTLSGALITSNGPAFTQQFPLSHRGVNL